ncbi:phosphotransferase family protein [Mycolicibacterium thermoresistibile]
MTAARSDTPGEELVSVAALDDWLDDRLPGSGPLTVERITTGHSNELFTVSRGGPTWLLRRPPRVKNAPTAHDMVREYRVLTALEGTDVPHATPRGLCADPDVIGAPFYLMDKLAGVPLYHELPASLAGERVAIAHAAIDALAALHRLDWRAAGLDGFGKPDGYTERQAARWGKQLKSYAFRELPELDEVAAWLDQSCPGTRGSALIHGDYGLHNLLYAPEPPVRILAVVDWETSTIGDPLADLGYFLASWLEPDEVAQWGELGSPHGVAGNPSRAELIERYARKSGIDVTADDLVWYRVFGQFKLAVIFEGSYGRYVRGQSADPFFASLERRVPLLARHALAIAAGEA